MVLPCLSWSTSTTLGVYPNWALLRSQYLWQTNLCPLLTFVKKPFFDVSITASVPTCNIFSSLPEDFHSNSASYVLTFLSTECIEGRLQQHFEHMHQLWNEVITITLHCAHGHPNNQTLFLNLKTHGISHKHLKRYILAVSGDACCAAIGKRNNKKSVVNVTKRQNIAEQTKVAKA